MRYAFRIRAVNIIGAGDFSPASRPVTPGRAPGRPEAPNGAAGNGQVALRWVAPDDGGSPITDYVVQYSANNGSTWHAFAHPASIATNVTVTGLGNGTGYMFRIAAKNALGTGEFSAASTRVTPVGAPGRPPAPTGTAGAGQVALRWSAPANGGSAITDYTVQFSADSGRTWRTFTHARSAASAITVTGLQNGTWYVFRVAAKNSVGTGTFSPASARLTKMQRPARLAAPVAVAGNSQVVLRWSAPANGGSAITDYVVQYSANKGRTWQTFAHRASPTPTVVVTRLANGTPYLFRVALVQRFAIRVG